MCAMPKSSSSRNSPESIKLNLKSTETRSAAATAAVISGELFKKVVKVWLLGGVEIISADAIELRELIATMLLDCATECLERAEVESKRSLDAARD